MNALRKTERGWAQSQWLESARWARLAKRSFIILCQGTLVSVEINVMIGLLAQFTVEIGWAMDWADIQNTFKEAGRINDVTNVSKLANLNRRQECQANRGVVRQKHCQRRLINQHRVECHKLSHAEGHSEKEEHLWTDGSKCNESDLLKLTGVSGKHEHWPGPAGF